VLTAAGRAFSFLNINFFESSRSVENRIKIHIQYIAKMISSFLLHIKFFREENLKRENY